MSLEYIDSIDCILLATKYITKIIDVIAKEKIILSKDSVGFFDKKITDIKPKPVRKPDGRKRNPRRKKKVTGSWLFVRG